MTATTRPPLPPTPDLARLALPVFVARVKAAGQRYIEVRAALEEARADLDIVKLTAAGEFTADPPVEWEVGANGLRRVQPVRAYACGSRGAWSWAY